MRIINIVSIISIFLLFSYCSKEESLEPLSDFQFLVNGTEVTFNGTVRNAKTIEWDFGDGNSNNEEDPIHAYRNVGDYEVSMKVTDASGKSFKEVKKVTILASPAILLIGGKANESGKTWKISKVYKAGKDGAGGVSDDLDIQILSVDNVLGLFGLSDVYEDQFTFFHDGRYVVDNKDGKSMMGVVYALINHAQNIRVVSADTQSLPLADVIYTPKSDATWEIKKGDFEVAAATGNVKFTDKTQLVLTEYLAYKDAGTFVILKELTDNYMNIALGIHTEPSIIDKPTLLFHMSLTAE
jgi:PKD repeat protein